MGVESSFEDLKKEASKDTLGISDLPEKMTIGTMSGIGVGISSGFIQQQMIERATRRNKFRNKNEGIGREIERYVKDLGDAVAKSHLDDIYKVAMFDSPSGAYDRACGRGVALNMIGPNGGQHLSPWIKKLRSDICGGLDKLTTHASDWFKWPKGEIDYSCVSFFGDTLSQTSGAFNRDSASHILMSKRKATLEVFGTLLKKNFFNATPKYAIEKALITSEPGMRQCEQLIALFENPTTGIISGVMPILMQCGASFGEYTAVIMNECGVAMKTSLYQDKTTGGEPLYWGFYDWVKDGSDPNKKNTISQIYQALTSGVPAEFSVSKPGDIVGYKRMTDGAGNYKTINDVFGCSNNRFGVENYVKGNKDFIEKLLENDSAFDMANIDFSTTPNSFEQKLKDQYLGTFEVEIGHGGKQFINVKERPSELSKCFRRAMAFGSDPNDIDTKSIGLPPELLMWQAIANNDIINDYIENKKRREGLSENDSRIKKLRSRQKRIVNTVRELEMQRGPGQEYLQFAQDILAKISGPKYNYVMYAAGEASWDKYDDLLVYALVMEKCGLDRNYHDAIRTQRLGGKIETFDKQGNKIVIKNPTIYDVLNKNGAFTDYEKKHVGGFVVDYIKEHPDYKNYIPQYADILKHLQNVQHNVTAPAVHQHLTDKGIDRYLDNLPIIEGAKDLSDTDVRAYSKSMTEARVKATTPPKPSKTRKK